MQFEHNYLVFDEFGEKEILCMSCASPIKTRSEIKGQYGIIRELAKHPEYKEIPVILEGNKIAFVMVCDNCKFIEIGEKECELITKQINMARESQFKQKGLSDEYIQPALEKLNIKVLRKADVHELTAALRGIQ